jgi:prevent-host-death family protein
MSKQCSLAEARDRLTRLVRDVEKGETVKLTRRGKPVAVIVSIREFQGMRDGKVGYWEALCKWRASHNLKSLQIDPDIFQKVRDRSPGRRVAW